MIALPKTNIAPENGWLEDEISFWEGLFSLDMLVSGKVVGDSGNMVESVLFALFEYDKRQVLS